MRKCDETFNRHLLSIQNSFILHSLLHIASVLYSYVRYLVFCMSCGGHNKQPGATGAQWELCAVLVLVPATAGVMQQPSHGRLLTTATYSHLQPPTATGLPSFQSPVPQYKMCKTLQRFSIPFNTQQTCSRQGSASQSSKAIAIYIYYIVN